MDLSLEGKIAIVTGGSKGIGRAAALALAQEGADVAICARGMEDLEDAAAEIRSKTGRKALAVQADMSSPGDIKNLVATTVAELGGVDILINNAVNSKAAPFLELADEDWLNHINVKIMGYVRCSREVIPHMQARGGGRIINIGGMAARQANTSSPMMMGPLKSLRTSSKSVALSKRVGAKWVRRSALAPACVATLPTSVEAV